MPKNATGAKIAALATILTVGIYRNLDKEENMRKRGKCGENLVVNECAGCGFVQEDQTCYVFSFPCRIWEGSCCSRRTEDQQAIQKIETATVEYAKKKHGRE